MRLNKFIAHHTGISRREADDLISSSQVTVNGRPATLGTQLSSVDSVQVAGKAITSSHSYTYLALHKPVGYVCSRRQQGDTPTIYSLLPPQLRALKPVGRLDADSSGLLLLTDDGDFAHRMTHPSFVKTKIYQVELDHDLTPLHHQIINDHGVQLPDGHSQLALQRQHDGNSRHWIVTMHEGRNRQIRRTFAALGYDVTRLHRTNFGPYTLDDLATGKNKPISTSSRA